MKLLGYVIYGGLADDEERIDEWIVRVSECQEKEMCDIRNSCFKFGTDFMQDAFGITGLTPDEDWLNIAAYFRRALRGEEGVLAAMLHKDEEHRLRLDPMQKPENKKWVEESERIKTVIEKWLRPITWQEDVKCIGTATFSLAEDVGFQFQIGNLNGGCLALVEASGADSSKLLGLITDVNKRLLLCRAKDGGLIGRRFIGISDSGLHMCPVYPKYHPMVSDVFRQGEARLLREIGCPKAATKSNLCPCGITAPAYSCEWDVGCQPIG